MLVAAGYSSILLALFYQVIDVWGLRTWSLPFIWIGMNPITIYLAGNLIDVDALAHRLMGGEIKDACGRYGEVLVAATVTLLVFALARFLYRRRIFLRL